MNIKFFCKFIFNVPLINIMRVVSLSFGFEVKKMIFYLFLKCFWRKSMKLQNRIVMRNEKFSSNNFSWFIKSKSLIPLRNWNFGKINNLRCSLLWLFAAICLSIFFENNSIQFLFLGPTKTIVMNLWRNKLQRHACWVEI